MTTTIMATGRTRMGTDMAIHIIAAPTTDTAAIHMFGVPTTGTAVTHIIGALSTVIDMVMVIDMATDTAIAGTGSLAGIRCAVGGAD